MLREEFKVLREEWELQVLKELKEPKVEPQELKVLWEQQVLKVPKVLKVLFKELKVR